MSQRKANAFPKGALLGAAALVGFALISAAGARLTDSKEAVIPATLPAVASRDLNFVDAADGSVGVFEASSGEAVARLAPGTNGFARALLRGLARERRREGATHEAPFRLTLRADGGLMLQDTANGHLVELEAFGPTNAAVFANLLTREVVQ